MRLKNEINQLRKKNNNVYANRNIPKQIVYIGQSYNQKSFRKPSPNQYNNSLNTYPYKNTSNKNNNNKVFIKLPFKQGMFSYKNSVSITTNNNNNNNYNNSDYNYNKNNNNSLLAPGLKLNINNDVNDSNNLNNNSNKFIGNNRTQSRFSSSSLDLNKYKIPFNSNSNVQSKRGNNAYVINNINNNIHSVENYNKNNKKLNINNNNSLEMCHISPIPQKKQKPQMSSMSLLGIDDCKSNNSPIKKNNSNNTYNEKTDIISPKNIDHFKNKPKNEKESRRMIIEYIKVLSNKYPSTNGNINKVMKMNKISRKVLNQEFMTKNFSSSLSNSNFEKSKISNNNNANSILLNNSISIVNGSSINNSLNHKPAYIKNNINRFLNEMKDELKDKVSMIKFLSIPRIMDFIFENKKMKYVFYLCPSNVSYINGIEGYIFKWIDIKSQKPVGGFDLIKITFCGIKVNEINNFIIKTFDGKIQRNYEFITGDGEIADYYVRSINYLSQLEKCKTYNSKNILGKENNDNGMRIEF